MLLEILKREFGLWKRVAKNKPKIIRIRKVIKRKDEKINVKRNCGGNSFNSWINKTDTV